LNSQPNSESAPSTDFKSPNNFTPQVEVGLAEILQACCPGRRSGQLLFRSGASYGYVFLQQGQVLHAMCGTVEGEEAVYLMLSWPAGSYTLDEDILPHKRTIHGTWEQLLFEGARRADVGNVSPYSTTPVTTANPLTSTRAKDSQPKLIISLEGQAPATFELQHEFTRLGRAEDNELSIQEGSVSNRHCIFILSGADVVLRDLNSSNGTYVNGEQISETVLRPGDNIQVGVIDIKFVPGIRRPKLTATSAPARAEGIRKQKTGPTRITETTIKLPSRAPRTGPPVPMLDNAAFVSGSSAISYEQLAPEAPAPKKPWAAIIGGVVVVVLILAGAAYYFLVLKR
jgi:pSer/pThr/pTyr-binding forkhead associated (FHA) protein